MLPGRKIIIASRNPAKVREIAAVLGQPAVDVVSLDEIDPGGRIAEPAEDGQTFAENARAKADYYAKATGCWALGDDSGLVVDALGGLPGVRSARYAVEEFPPNARREDIDKANNAKLLRELAGVESGGRTARFICHLALSDGRRTLLEAEGVVAGIITLEPHGSNGFGYDPIFLIPDLGQTVAEISPERKNEISHRGLAVRKFAHLLKEMPAGPKDRGTGQG